MILLLFTDITREEERGATRHIVGWPDIRLHGDTYAR